MAAQGFDPLLHLRYVNPAQGRQRFVQQPGIGVLVADSATG
jgi:hypothetical protein